MAGDVTATQGGPGEAPRFTAINPEWQDAVDKLNAMAELVESSLLRPGPGYDYTRGPGGTSMVIPRPPPRVETSTRPFTVKMRQKQGSTTEWEASVYVYSFVLAAEGAGANVCRDIKVQGQNLTAFTGPTQNEPRWFDFIPTDLIWLEYSGGIWSIRSFGMGDTWEDPTQHFQSNTDGSQAAWRLEIASSQEESGKPPKVIQYLDHNILEKTDICYNGFTYSAGVPWGSAPHLPTMP